MLKNKCRKKNFESMDMNILDGKCKNFISFDKEKQMYVDDEN